MKKKIKDLSKKQIDTICKKYGKRDEKGLVHCNECPLSSEYHCVCIKSQRRWFLKEYGNEEIEVDEDESNK